jgi:sugar/nucleoside kinase (ribokinase family)
MQGITELNLPKIFVIGDLNIDNVVTGAILGKITRVVLPAPSIGGSAYNAARAFKQAGFHTMLFGKVGNDADGNLIVLTVEQNEIHHFIGRDEKKPTGTCHIIYFQGADNLRTIYFPCPNANDYDLCSIEHALKESALGPDDFVFTSLHIYDQVDRNLDHCRNFFNTLHASGCRVIVDIVPHTIYEDLNVSQFNQMIGGPVYMIISEYRTFMHLISCQADILNEAPTESDCQTILHYFKAQYYVCRSGIGNISRQLVFNHSHSSNENLGTIIETGFEKLPDIEKRGFGDRLTANTLLQMLNFI